MGWETPEAATDAVSSASLASSNWVRVWKGLRSIWPTGISSGLPGAGSGAAAGGGVGAGRDGSSDSRPLPRARRLGSCGTVDILDSYSLFDDLLNGQIPDLRLGSSPVAERNFGGGMGSRISF